MARGVNVRFAPAVGVQPFAAASVIHLVRLSTPGPEADEVAPKVSAAVIFDQIHLMRASFGDDVLSRALGRLGPDLRQEVAMLSPGGWVSLDAARELKEAVAELVGVDALDLQRQLSARGVERTLNTFWRFFLRRLSDEALSKRAPILYARTFSRGSFTLTSWERGAADFELRGWRIPEYDLAGLAAGIARVLELAGRRDVRLTTTRRANFIALRATWPWP